MELLHFYLEQDDQMRKLIAQIEKLSSYEDILYILENSAFKKEELYFYLYDLIYKQINDYTDKLLLEAKLGINYSLDENYGHTLRDFAKIYSKDNFYNCMNYLLIYDNLYEYLRGECNFKYPSLTEEAIKEKERNKMCQLLDKIFKRK